jgi:hypothetical protein
VYQGDEGRRKVRMAVICLLERDGLLLRVGDIQCPVHWLHVSWEDPVTCIMLGVNPLTDRIRARRTRSTPRRSRRSRSSFLSARVKPNWCRSRVEPIISTLRTQARSTRRCWRWSTSISSNSRLNAFNGLKEESSRAFQPSRYRPTADRPGEYYRSNSASTGYCAV